MLDTTNLFQERAATGLCDLHEHELIVDLFAGGGGASEGIFIATGRHPDIAINHDENAIAVHTRNHPTTKHYCQSIWKVHPLEAVGDRPVGLLWASPDCFPHGTLVTTPDGQKPIEHISEGQLVLTHKGRWRRVTSTLSRGADTVRVRGHGHYGLVTTPTHQFYSKRITTRYPGRKKDNGCRVGPQRTLVENPYWPSAQDMTGKLWATPRTFPAASIPICQGVEFSEGFFYFLGRWIGDGSINKGDVEICCGNAELAEFLALMEMRPLMSAEGERIPYRIVEHGSSKLVVWGCQALATWLTEQVGTGCENKRLPLWCLSMQANWRTELLRGYSDADGHDGALRVETKTVSKALAVNIRLLATTLGYAASFYIAPGEDGEIEGRPYKGQDCYRVAWTRDCQRETTFRDTLHAFSPVREVTPLGVRLVVSLQVDEDESFVADGIVVHNCRHFSRASGGQPKWKSVRSLPGVVLTWAKFVRPKSIFVENVPEMVDWGPLLEDGTPCPKRVGRSFKVWCGRLRGLGYHLAFRRMCAADYGVPTIRTRLFIVARLDAPPQWPQPTHHRKPSLFEQPWVPAASCIDWSIPCPSIFDRKRPLKDATLKRIAEGIHRYVLKAEEPFIVRTGHYSYRSGEGFGFRGQGVTEPLGTVCTTNEKAIVVPHVSSFYGASVGSAITQPLGTVTAQSLHQAIVAAHLAPVTHKGPRRGSGLDQPAPTLTCANRGEHALVSAFLGGCGGRAAQSPPKPLTEPANTITAKADQMLVSAFLAQHNGGMVGHSAMEPVSTLTGTGSQQQLVQATLSPEDAAGAERVAAFLIHYFSHGKQGQDLREPLGAITTKGRYALVTVAGVQLPIVDIGMRMLSRHELQAAQGFRPDYDLTDGGRLSKTDAIRLIGNSVCPGHAAAVIRANVRPAAAPVAAVAA